MTIIDEDLIFNLCPKCKLPWAFHELPCWQPPCKIEDVHCHQIVIPSKISLVLKP